MNEEVLYLFGQRMLITEMFGLNMETPTKCGIHMGLGPTWVILSLINVACAVLACGNTSTFLVCGDDLIAWWYPEYIETYNSLIEGLGMKINHSKSFRSPFAGVFCEGIVYPISEREACVSWVLKYAEKFNSKYRELGVGTALCSATATIGSKLHTKLMKGLPKGPFELGMGGKKIATKAQMYLAYRLGYKPITRVRNIDEISKGVSENIRKDTSKVRIPMNEVEALITRIAKEQRFNHAFDRIDQPSKLNKWLNGDARFLTTKVFRRILNYRGPSIKPSETPKWIRFMIRRFPWIALKAIARKFASRTISKEFLSSFEYSVVTNNGNVLTFSQARNKASTIPTRDIVHPLCQRLERVD
jgi:hypothetical protein